MVRSKTFLSYLAGFLDGDGSIYVRLKPNSTYKYDFQVAPSVVFFQSLSEKSKLQILKKRLGFGYLRERKDGIVEYTVGDRKSIRSLMKMLNPYLLFKKKQAKLIIEILDFSEKISSASDFLELAKLIDEFGKLNYSKKRTVNSRVVHDHLKSKGLLTP